MSSDILGLIPLLPTEVKKRLHDNLVQTARKYTSSRNLNMPMQLASKLGDVAEDHIVQYFLQAAREDIFEEDRARAYFNSRESTP